MVLDFEWNVPLLSLRSDVVMVLSTIRLLFEFPIDDHS